MSQENVDRFVRGIETFNRNDIPGVLRLMDPEIVWEHRLAELQGKFVGPEAVTYLATVAKVSLVSIPLPFPVAWMVPSPSTRSPKSRTSGQSISTVWKCS